MRKFALLTLGLCLGAPTLAADQFDLICKGNKDTVRIRVDLARGEWCWDTCFATWKIASVTSTRIAFKDEDTPSGKAYNYVDRVTGKWNQGMTDKYTSVWNSGFCEPAPFTGFGEEKAKF